MGSTPNFSEEIKIVPEVPRLMLFEVAKSLGVSIPRSNICGGGSRSPLWKTIMSNVLGIPLDTVATEQGPGYGGARCPGGTPGS